MEEHPEDDAATRRARAEALRHARDVRNARVHGHAVPAGTEPRDETTSREKQAVEEDTETSIKPVSLSPSSALNYVDLIDARMQQIENENLSEEPSS